jgi:hypothetical protein
LFRFVFDLVRRRSDRLKASGAGEHTVEEAVGILWMIIREAQRFMGDPLLSSEEKRRWAKTLADTIGVLNKLRDSLGEEPLEDEDLGTLLTRFPKKMQRAVVREVRLWRSKSLRLAC